MESLKVQQLAADSAGDATLMRDVARVINEAYATGEVGLWVDGATRVTPEQVAEAASDGSMLVASLGERVVGAARLQPLDETTADLGLISASLDMWGTGVGRELARTAEEVARERGASEMQLELLVPIEGSHPEKEKLRAWYERLGYRVVRVAEFEEVAEHLAKDLATPCEFLIFRKPLG